MATDGGNRDDFFEWAFEQSGRNPLAWQHSAQDLLEAADAVKARGVGMMPVLAAVQAMLIGVSTETRPSCLIRVSVGAADVVSCGANHVIGEARGLRHDETRCARTQRNGREPTAMMAREPA